MKRNVLRFLLVLIIVHMAFTFQGCLIATKKTVISPEIRSIFAGEHKVDPYMEKHKPKTVAVLPFADQSRTKKGTETVRKYFYNHFSSLPFKDMELYRIDTLLRKAGLDEADIMNKTPQELGDILNIDAVVYGSISNFDKLFAVIYSQVSVGAKIEMYDTKTGHFLWSGEHTTRIQEGGLSTTPVGIIATVIATSMNMRDIQLLRACDDLFRDMVQTIPLPSIAETARPPVITILTQDTQGLPKKAGDEITVVMKGTPKMQAYFDIGDYKKGIDMEEVEPGGYLGSYRVVPGDNVAEIVITGHLTDDTGNTARWIDAVGTVTLDTTPPDRPTGIKTVGRDTYVMLDWNRSSESDLAGYIVYRSITPLSGFTEVARIEFNQYRDASLENSVKYFYRLSTFDMAGNESETTDTIAALPVAPGPTPVSGNIDTHTIWYSGASPYVIEDTVVIKDKSLLTIEPGTTVYSKGSALIVEGRLLAAGDQNHLIHFEGNGGTRWRGVLFSNVREKENVVRFCRIKDANVGIICLSSSPAIEDNEIANNATGIEIAGAFSKPRITRNMIRKNELAGIVIADGAQPVLILNKIRDNGKDGIAITNSEPVIKENTIIQNAGSGVSVRFSQATISNNNIYDNSPFNMVGETKGKAINACENWWGSKDGLDILATINGKVNIRSVLDNSYPEGKPHELRILGTDLSNTVNSDSYLTVANSPYEVTKDLIIDNGATLYIEPGVTVMFDQNTSIITKDGGIIARGTENSPIVFTASGASASPGFYQNAVRFTTENTHVNSFFEYCVVKYATTAFDVQFGTPEISYCHIASNSQSGIYCRNDAGPKIYYNTFTGNLGEGAIRCVGMSKPVINYNNFIANSVAVQSFSSIYVDARYNWWGTDPPDVNLIWGKNINIVPWLTAPEEKAFSETE